MDFKIAVEQDEDGWYIVTVPALPGCVSRERLRQRRRKTLPKPSNYISAHSLGMEFPYISDPVQKKCLSLLTYDRQTPHPLPGCYQGTE